MTKLIFKS